MCVCPPSADTIKHLHSILNTAIGFLLSIEAEGFQLTDLSKQASFRSYSHFHSFISMTWQPFAVHTVQKLYVRTELAPYHLWLARLGSVYCMQAHARGIYTAYVQYPNRVHPIFATW